MPAHRGVADDATTQLMHEALFDKRAAVYASMTPSWSRRMTMRKRKTTPEEWRA